MSSMNKKSASEATLNQASSDASPQPRVASGTLPPLAAHAPEFIPSENLHLTISDQNPDNQKGDKKTSDAGSDKEKAPHKKTKERTKAEKEAEEKAQKQKAMDEEWWSGDEVFIPN